MTTGHEAAISPLRHRRYVLPGNVHVETRQSAEEATLSLGQRDGGHRVLEIQWAGSRARGARRLSRCAVSYFIAPSSAAWSGPFAGAPSERVWRWARSTSQLRLARAPGHSVRAELVRHDAP